MSVSPYKKEQFEQAQQFRRRGFTYAEIARICGVSRGTVSNWLKDEDFSKQVRADNQKRAAKENQKRLKLMHKARTAERAARYREAERSAETEFKHYRHSPLFMAGLSLYMARGDIGADNPIRFSGQNPALHRVFVRFATDFLGVERSQIHCALLLYPAHDEVRCLKHWSRKLKLSVAQFYRSQIVTARSDTASLHFGTGNTIIGSTFAKRKLLRWVELAHKELNK